MSDFEITSTQEDYLRAIYLLQKENNGVARVSQLVEKMGLSKSTIAQRLQDLKDKGWVVHKKYGPVKLSETGKKIADNLTYKHRVVEIFLNEVLGLPKDEVHDEAHRLEHALSSKVILKMADYIGDPTHCPHGKKLPDFHEKI